MKQRRISLPSSPRTGMFCRLGSEEDSRPVAVTAWLNEVCMCPVRGLMSLGSASTYVPSSFFSARWASMSATTGLLCESCCSTSSEVTYCPVLVFLGLSTIFILPNSISPTCLGEAMLNSSPASLYMRCSMSCMRAVSVADTSASVLVSMRTPVVSMSASTGTRGISISVNSSQAPASWSCGSSTW